MQSFKYVQVNKLILYFFLVTFIKDSKLQTKLILANLLKILSTFLDKPKRKNRENFLK